MGSDKTPANVTRMPNPAKRPEGTPQEQAAARVGKCFAHHFVRLNRIRRVEGAHFRQYDVFYCARCLAYERVLVTRAMLTGQDPYQEALEEVGAPVSLVDPAHRAIERREAAESYEPEPPAGFTAT